MDKRVSAEKESGMTTNAPSSTSLKNAVHRRRDQHVAAVNAGDAESTASLFDPDGIFLPPGQPALQGTSVIRAWFGHVFANFRVKEFGLQPAATEQRGDIAIEHGNWNATFQPKNGSPELPVGGTYVTVYARLSDGSIRMIHDTFNGMP
jgi:uncharacterized protein (TIGR02246 family)